MHFKVRKTLALGEAKTEVRDAELEAIAFIQVTNKRGLNQAKGMEKAEREKSAKDNGD